MADVAGKAVSSTEGNVVTVRSFSGDAVAGAGVCGEIGDASEEGVVIASAG